MIVDVSPVLRLTEALHLFFMGFADALHLALARFMAPAPGLAWVEETLAGLRPLVEAPGLPLAPPSECMS